MRRPVPQGANETRQGRLREGWQLRPPFCAAANFLYRGMSGSVSFAWCSASMRPTPCFALLWRPISAPVADALRRDAWGSHPGALHQPLAGQHRLVQRFVRRWRAHRHLGSPCHRARHRGKYVGGSGYGAETILRSQSAGCLPGGSRRSPASLAGGDAACAQSARQSATRFQENFARFAGEFDSDFVAASPGVTVAS